MNRKFDSAALLIAVLVVVIGPLTTVGPWDKINTILAAAVGIILAAFTWPRTDNFWDADKPDKAPLQDVWIKIAFATAYGLIIAVGSAWIVQSILNPPTCPNYFNDNDAAALQACNQADNVAGQATSWALGIGLVAAVILFIVLRARVNKLKSSAPRPAERVPPDETDKVDGASERRGPAPSAGE